MALTPSLGRELWQARPRVRSFQRTAPRWATMTLRSVGSATTATVGAADKSEPDRAGSLHNRARALAPWAVDSSSHVHDMTTLAARFGRSATSRANAANMAAIPPFTSQAPRPYSRPSLTTG